MKPISKETTTAMQEATQLLRCELEKQGIKNVSSVTWSFVSDAFFVNTLPPVSNIRVDCKLVLQRSK